jgi:hypothetical protein
MKIKLLVALVALLAVISNQSFAQPTLKSGGSSLKATVDNSGKTPKITLQTEFSMEETFKQIQAYMDAAKKWKKLKCTPKSGFICTKRECIKRKPVAWLVLDKDKETVSRCEGEEEKDCVTYDAEFSQSGVNVNIQGEEPNGAMVKVLGNNRYKEIVTIGLDAYIFNGECVEMDE